MRVTTEPASGGTTALRSNESTVNGNPLSSDPTMRKSRKGVRYGLSSAFPDVSI